MNRILSPWPAYICPHISHYNDSSWEQPFWQRRICPALSLSPCVCLLTLLPGHCAHSLSVTISSKLHEAHYSHIPPGGVGARQHLHREAQTLYGWLAEDRNLSAPPLCALFFSSLPFPLIFLLYSEKGWIKDDISATGQEVRSHVSRSLNQPWEPGWLLSVKLCQLTTGCWRL